jgi:hypothetical protein
MSFFIGRWAFGNAPIKQVFGCVFSARYPGIEKRDAGPMGKLAHRVAEGLRLEAKP